MGKPSWKGRYCKKMRIGFIGNFHNGYVGEVADQVHISREMKALGHDVYEIAQDEWREYVIEDSPKDKYKNVPEGITFDFIIITKWHHFYDGSFIRLAREKYECPVFYWVWDYMYDQGVPPWHQTMVEVSDLYLGNDVHDPFYMHHKNAYYFPFDVADGDLLHYQLREHPIDVAFFGSWIGQGDRQRWLTEINKTNPITVFSWNYKDWPKEFTDVHPAVYGQEFCKKVEESKIILGLSVEPNCWGYWSNRTGKILTLGGFLLYQYAPGMELFLKDGAEYFSSIDEAREKIDHYLIAVEERQAIASRGFEIGQQNFTSKQRVKELMILAERFIKTGGKEWKL